MMMVDAKTSPSLLNNYEIFRNHGNFHLIHLTAVDYSSSSTDAAQKTKGQSSDQHHLRRSSRHRSAKGSSPDQSESSAIDIDVANIKLPDGPKRVKAEAPKRILRSSKSLTHTDNDPSTAQQDSLTPRKYTRPSAKTADHNEVTIGSDTYIMPVSLVVLSDICASQDRRLPCADDVPDQETSNANSTPVLDDPVDNKHTAKETLSNRLLPSTESLEVTTQSSSEQMTDNYEPELHFDEMSKVVAEEAGPCTSRSDAVTPTLDEPTSPTRMTESPTSPTPSSPTESCSPCVNASMVTIPLEGEDSYQAVVVPPVIPSIPTGNCCRCSTGKTIHNTLIG